VASVNLRSSANNLQVEIYCRSELDHTFMLIVGFVIWSGVAYWFAGVYHGNVLKFRPWENAVIPSYIVEDDKAFCSFSAECLFLYVIFLVYSIAAWFGGQ